MNMYEQLDFLTAYLTEKWHDCEIGRFVYSHVASYAAYEYRFEIVGMPGYVYSAYLKYNNVINNPQFIIDDIENNVLPKINNKLYTLFYKAPLATE